MARFSSYFKDAATVVVDGTNVEFGAEQYFYNAKRKEGATTIQGTNNAMTQFSTDQRAEVSVMIFGISLTNDVLEELWVNQNSGNARLFDITIGTSEGEQISLERCSIMKPPDVQGGSPAQQSRTWEFNVERYNPDKSNF